MQPTPLQSFGRPNSGLIHIVLTTLFTGFSKRGNNMTAHEAYQICRERKMEDISSFDLKQLAEYISSLHERIEFLQDCLRKCQMGTEGVDFCKEPGYKDGHIY